MCAPKPFTGDLMDEDAVITRSVSSSKLKAGLPFTYTDLLLRLERPDRLSRTISAMMFRVLSALSVPLGESWRFANNPAFQLFGIDVVITRTGGVRLVEMNSGPELRALCARDHELKSRMVYDQFALTGLLPQLRDNGFRRLPDLPQATVGDSTRGDSSTS